MIITMVPVFVMNVVTDISIYEQKLLHGINCTVGTVPLSEP
jgi:hypothetical protein